MIDGEKIKQAPENPPEPTAIQPSVYAPERRPILYNCTKCSLSFFNKQEMDQHLDGGHGPSDLLKIDIDRRNKLIKDEEEKNRKEEATPKTQCTINAESHLDQENSRSLTIDPNGKIIFSKEIHG